MIKYITHKCENLYTEGLEVSTSSLSIFVTEGKVHFGDLVHKEEETKDENGKIIDINHYTETEWSVDDYIGFSFDVEPDENLDVVYDVYLLDDFNEQGVNIHVDRTEIMADNLAFYSGEIPNKHTLLTTIIPAGTTTLDDVVIKVNHVEKMEVAE